MYSGCTLKLTKLRVFKGFLHLRLPASLGKRSLGDFVFGTVGLRFVTWGPLGAWWRGRATPRLARSSLAEQEHHRARLGARRRDYEISVMASALRSTWHTTRRGPPAMY